MKDTTNLDPPLQVTVPGPTPSWRHAFGKCHSDASRFFPAQVDTCFDTPRVDRGGLIRIQVAAGEVDAAADEVWDGGSEGGYEHLPTGGRVALPQAAEGLKGVGVGGRSRWHEGSLWLHGVREDKFGTGNVVAVREFVGGLRREGGIPGHDRNRGGEGTFFDGGGRSFGGGGLTGRCVWKRFGGRSYER